MRIQYMSDLHMEFAENSRYIKHNEFPVTGEVLVLAGDTFYLTIRLLRSVSSGSGHRPTIVRF